MTLAVTTLVLATSSAIADPPPESRLISIGTAAVYRSCHGANEAIDYYRRAYRDHREQMGVEGMPARRWWGCESARRRAVEWRDKAAAARKALKKWVDYQYDWRSWLPRNWYLVGSCETGYGGAPNFNHANSSFVSAFGISRSIYDRDAAYAGGPPWNDASPPTPRQQYEAALAHYAQFGDGWGCPGP